MRAYLDRYRPMMIPLSLPWSATASVSVVNIVAGVVLVLLTLKQLRGDTIKNMSLLQIRVCLSVCVCV